MTSWFLTLMYVRWIMRAPKIRPAPGLCAVITVWGRYVFQITDLLIDDSQKQFRKSGFFAGLTRRIGILMTCLLFPARIGPSPWRYKNDMGAGRSTTEPE